MGHTALGIAGQTMHLKDCHLKHVPENIKKIILLYDDIKFALERAEEIKEYFQDSVEVLVACYPDNLDANDYLVQGRKADFDAIVKTAKSHEELKDTNANKSTLKELDIENIAIPEDDFVTNYCNEYACKCTDAPRKYNEAVALSLISTVIGRKIYFRFGRGKIYLNIWAVLIGKSTIMRKSESISAGRDLLDKELIIPSEFSPEGLFSQLSEKPQGLIIWPEFGGFLSGATKNYNIGVKEFLAELFDCNDIKKKLKKDEFTIKDPCVSILTATTMDWLVDRIDNGDIKGGFLGRFVYIIADYEEKDNLYIIPDPPEESVLEKLKSKLDEISKAGGQFAISSSAYKLYAEWFKKHEYEMSKMPDNKGISGFYGRLSIYALKFAMLYEISQNQKSLAISEIAMKRALKFIEERKKDISRILENDVSFGKEEKKKIEFSR